MRAVIAKAYWHPRGPGEMCLQSLPVTESGITVDVSHSSMIRIQCVSSMLMGQHDKSRSF